MRSIHGLVIFLGGPTALPGIDTVNASIDSEMRFYAVFWMAYGFFAAWVAPHLLSRHQFVPAIILFLAIGIVEPVISFVVAGRPSDFLVIDTIIEFINVVLTTVFYILYRRGITQIPLSGITGGSRDSRSTLPM